LAREIPDGERVTFFKQGSFIDLCAGPHLTNTKHIKAFKLTNEAGSSGAYWRGNEKNKMLARIYGTAFFTKDELAEYLTAKEEAKKRDHNKLGRELKYFTTSELVGQGLPLIMPKGAKVIQILQRFVEDEEERRGYVLTKTPVMAKNDLFKVSGHWEIFPDGMFSIYHSENETLVLRPVTCPHQFAIYNSEQHSYRDLPIRYGETSTLFRNEASGEMHGLIRVRQFTLSEGHIVCTRDQLEQEFFAALDTINFMMKTLGIDKTVTYRFSKWDENKKEDYIGDETVWEETQRLMKEMLDKSGLTYIEADGEAAMYGPKLDIQMKNVHGKEDTAITLQIDFALAERFGMTYIDQTGAKARPVVIHRSSVGSYERTLAFLIEHYAGALPLWLSPVQARVLPISEKFEEYAGTVCAELKRAGIRAEVDGRNEKIGYKIRDARNERLPYILVVGEREEADKGVAVRSRDGDEGFVPLAEFKERISGENEERK
jgi:threonyl-tRNA synthetase